jgi:hypothetical protein
VIATKGAQGSARVLHTRTMDALRLENREEAGAKARQKAQRAAGNSTTVRAQGDARREEQRLSRRSRPWRRSWGKEKSMRQGNKGGGSAPWHSRIQRPAEEPGARREMEKSSSGGGWKMKVGHGMKKI